MTMAHVAYLCADPGVPAFGTKGASVHVQEIIRAFQHRGEAVRLYTARTDDHVPADLQDLPVTHRPVDTREQRRADREVSAAERTARRERRQARAAGELATQVRADGADLIYERYSLFSTALAQVSGALDIPGVLEVNAPLIDEQARHRHLVDHQGALDALRTQVAAAAVVTCVSEPVAAWLRHHCPGHADRVRVIPNGVNTTRIVPSTPRVGADPVVLFVGTLKPWHGVEVLLEAAALGTRPWQVRIVGDGPQREALVEQADRLGLQVDFRGALAPQDVPAALSGSTVAVAPYPASAAHDQYFSPLKIYEYAAAGLPVIASAVGQVPGIVADGQSGVLVPPSDPAALARAIDTLVADPARAAALGLAGRANVERDHSWDRVLQSTLAGIAPGAEAVA